MNKDNLESIRKDKRDNAALLDYINLRRREELLNLRGTLRWEGNLDQMRKRRVP